MCNIKRGTYSTSGVAIHIPMPQEINTLVYFTSLLQEREEAEVLWAADGQSVLKKDEKEAEGSTTAGRNARSHAPKERNTGRGTITGRKDELWEPEQSWQTETGIYFYSVWWTSPLFSTSVPIHLYMIFQFLPKHSIISCGCLFMSYCVYCVYTLFILYMMQGSERNCVLSCLCCQSVLLFQRLFLTNRWLLKWRE